MDCWVAKDIFLVDTCVITLLALEWLGALVIEHVFLQNSPQDFKGHCANMHVNWGHPACCHPFYFTHCNWPWVRTTACSDSCTGGTWRALGHCLHESPRGSANLLGWGSVSHRSSSCEVSGVVWGIYSTDWKIIRNKLLACCETSAILCNFI